MRLVLTFQGQCWSDFAFAVLAVQPLPEVGNSLAALAAAVVDALTDNVDSASPS